MGHVIGSSVNSGEPAAEPLALAKQYLRYFFSPGELDSLAELLTDDFHFHGPLYEFHTAAEYMQSLRADPPRGMTCRITHTFQSATSALVLYEFSKGSIQLPMSQLFETRDGLLCNSLLIFDSHPILSGEGVL